MVWPPEPFAPWPGISPGAARAIPALERILQTGTSDQRKKVESVLEAIRKPVD